MSLLGDRGPKVAIFDADDPQCGKQPSEAPVEAVHITVNWTAFRVIDADGPRSRPIHHQDSGCRSAVAVMRGASPVGGKGPVIMLSEWLTQGLCC